MDILSDIMSLIQIGMEKWDYYITREIILSFPFFLFSHIKFHIYKIHFFFLILSQFQNSLSSFHLKH